MKGNLHVANQSAAEREFHAAVLKASHDLAAEAAAFVSAYAAHQIADTRTFKAAIEASPANKSALLAAEQAFSKAQKTAAAEQTKARKDAQEKYAAAVAIADQTLQAALEEREEDIVAHDRTSAEQEENVYMLKTALDAAEGVPKDFDIADQQAKVALQEGVVIDEMGSTIKVFPPTYMIPAGEIVEEVPDMTSAEIKKSLGVDQEEDSREETALLLA